MIDHEAREFMADRAGYAGKTPHNIALAKEKRDLERKGLLPDFLNWLKVEYPNAYRKRIKKWKIK